MDAETRLRTEQRIIAILKTVYDPEIPVNIYDLGLIYKIDLQDNGEVVLDMTLTAPNCPAADFIMEDVRQKVDSAEGVTSSVINLVFEPEWDKDMMSEEAKLELGFLGSSLYRNLFYWMCAAFWKRLNNSWNCI